MDKPTMEDSSIIQRYKQKLAEKMNPKAAAPEDDPEGEQIDFDKFMKGSSNVEN